MDDPNKKMISLLNAMGKAAKIGGWAFNVETGEGVWTDELYRIFELPVGQKPQIEDSIEFYQKEDRAVISEAYRKAIEEGEPYDLELRFITAQKNHLWVRTICIPEVENGKTINLMGVFQDITGKKTAEEQRKSLEAQLQQAMKMEAIGRLAGGVAHDFNNLLTGIKGYTELLISDLDASHPMLNELYEIQKAAESAADLSMQLLMFSRKQIINPKILNLNDLIFSTRKMLERLIGEDIILKVALCEDLGSVKVDRGQFEQILVNLAINARDAMPEGGTLTITTANVAPDLPYRTAQPGVQTDAQVMLAVSDTGHGMSEEVKEHLFEPFFTTKPMGRGTGLGLATIYGAIKQAGGNIEVDSQENRGSSFKIYLPRLPEKPKPQDSPAARPSKAITGKETIMLVEDEKIVRDLTVRILERFNYRVLSACDGRQAVSIVEEYQDPIHLVITDIILPGMNGRQLAERLLQLRPGIKILYISGYSDDVIARQGEIEKEINFVGKPFTSYELGKKVRELLD